jgi:hypothetical protein
MKKTWKLAPLAFALFLTANFSAPASAGPPICQVLCATTHCTTQDECPAGQRCDFACPGEGCCVE